MYVTREIKTGEVRIQEIGWCDDPRKHPDMWCDARVCEGFWGDREEAERFVNALNAATTEIERLRSVLQAIREHSNIDGECAVDMQKAAAWALDPKWPKPEWLQNEDKSRRLR